ncbi:MAG TPA: DUF3189 family protein [Clostridia bacterium]|nr:DUF3189 family protein [Clostridia bacterium]
MYIIYHCYGGAHSSVTAAAIHLGLLPEDRLPRPEELMALPFYDQTTARDHGRLRCLGEDVAGNRVFVIGRRGLKDCFTTLVETFSSRLQIPREELLIVDTVPCVNLMMMVGGFTSRRLGWTKIGRPLVIRGTQKAFGHFVRLVRTVKAQAAGGTAR